MKPWEENKKTNYIKNAKKDFEILVCMALKENRIPYELYMDYIKESKIRLDSIYRHNLYNDMVKEVENLFAIYVNTFFPDCQ